MAFPNKRDFGQGSSVADHLAIGEALNGTLDGVNTVFTTTSPVVGSAIDVFLNTQFQTPGGVDYTFSAPNTITFVIAPPSSSVGGNQPRATYIK